MAGNSPRTDGGRDRHDGECGPQPSPCLPPPHYCAPVVQVGIPILSSLAARRLAPRVSCSRPRPACLSGWRHTHFRILACASYRAVHLEWKEVFQYLELAFTVCKACRFDGRNILRHFFITQETQTVLTIESPVSRRLFASYLMTDWYFEASWILKCWVKPKNNFRFWVFLPWHFTDIVLHESLFMILDEKEL